MSEMWVDIVRLWRALPEILIMTGICMVPALFFSWAISRLVSHKPDPHEIKWVPHPWKAGRVVREDHYYFEKLTRPIDGDEYS